MDPVRMEALPDWVAVGLRAMREGWGLAVEEGAAGRSSFRVIALEAAFPAASIPSMAESVARSRARAAAGSHHLEKRDPTLLEEPETVWVFSEEAPPDRPGRESAEAETGPSPRPVETVGAQPLAPTSVVTLLPLP